MTEYALYAESGPRHKQTLVDVIGLLGCTAQGPTTREALAATPHAIRQFLGFLQHHGDTVDPQAPFTTVVREHVIKRSTSAQGNPPDGFPPDFAPLSADELQVLLERRRWLRQDLAAMLGRVTPQQRLEKPVKARSLARIVEHIAEASGTYLCNSVGTVDGLSEALYSLRESHGDLNALMRVWRTDETRWNTLSEVERTQTVRQGQQTWTARRSLRRVLEHEWEHLEEIRQRVG